MTASASSTAIEAQAADDPLATAARGWRTIERVLRWAGDRLNPILVKETRQALKSRQFTITFALLLLCGWAWSLLGVALVGPEIWRGVSGPFMFFGYYTVLAFPLLVIVPFSAFRSLAGEQEDRTYELMSITTLGPRQIVLGKLGSAVLQMMIYLSAIAPCLAFSYLLRGIDFPTILFFVFYTVAASLGLSAIALLLGTISSEKHWQIVLSVFIVAGLLWAFGCALALTGELLSEMQGLFAEVEFWWVNGMILTALVSYLVLVLLAAAAQITFASDNRSTRLRVVMIVQQALLTGWCAWAWLGPARGDYGLLMVFMILAGLHWFVMGALMTGESPDLSPRVKRQLPQSFLGRVFLTWLNPGPGTGYMLAIGSLLGVLAMVILALAAGELMDFASLRPRGFFSHADHLAAFGVAGIAQVTIYLGVALLLLRLLRRVTQVRVLLAALIQIVLLLLGIFAPLIVHLMSPTLRGSDYNLLHVLSPYSLIYLIGSSSLPPETPVILVVSVGVALIVFVLNLPGVVREVEQVRIAKPRRVVEEDTALAAAKAPVEPIHTSPWD